MKFLTALSFLFCGASLVVLSVPRLRRMIGMHFASAVMAGLTFAIMFCSLLNASFNGVPITDFFVMESAAAVQTVAPGKPSLATILSFMALAAYIVTVPPDCRWIRSKLHTGLAVSVIATASTALVGYAANRPELYFYFPGRSTAMALHTAIFFLVLGVIAARLPKSEEHSGQIG